MPKLPKPADANVEALAKVFRDLLVKLDADGGITNTDYEATLEITDQEDNVIGE